MHGCIDVWMDMLIDVYRLVYGSVVYRCRGDRRVIDAIVEIYEDLHGSVYVFPQVQD